MIVDSLQIKWNRTRKICNIMLLNNWGKIGKQHIWPWVTTKDERWTSLMDFMLISAKVTLNKHFTFNYLSTNHPHIFISLSHCHSYHKCHKSIFHFQTASSSNVLTLIIIIVQWSLKISFWNTLVWSFRI